MTKESKKICWSCEARVGLEATYCPFCGTDLLTKSAVTDGEGLPEEDVASLYTPPYFAKPSTDFLSQPSVEPEGLPNLEPKAKATNAQEAAGHIWPTVCLMLGSYLFVVGAMIFLFAEKGKLTLQWDEGDWLVYFLLATPLLVLGWRFSKRYKAD